MQHHIDNMEQIDALLAQGDRGAAHALLQETLASMPSNWEPIQQEGADITGAFWDLDEFRAYIRSRSSRTEGTIRWVTPSYSKFWYQLSTIHVDAGDYENALRCSDAGLAVEPDHPLLWIEKGLALNRLGRHSEALEAYKTAEAIRSWSPPNLIARALRGQGASLIDLNRLDEAREAFERSLKLDPDSEVAKQELDYIAEELKEKKPLPWFLHCVKYPPSDPLTIQLLASVDGLDSIPGPQTVGSENYSKIFNAFMAGGWRGFEDVFDQIVPRTRPDYADVKRDLLREPVFRPTMHKMMARVVLGESTVEEAMQEVRRNWSRNRPPAV